MELKAVVAEIRKWRSRWQKKILGGEAIVGFQVLPEIPTGKAGRYLMGQCILDDSVYEQFHIQLGAQELDNPRAVRETLLHETVHALMSPIAEFKMVLASGVGKTREGKALLTLLEQAEEKSCIRITKALKNVGVK